MVKLKFVDIKHLESPKLWDNRCFVDAKCNFKTVGIATILCPAIKQIITNKGIIYFGNNQLSTNTYVLTCRAKEKSGIITNCNHCKHRIK